MNKREFNKILNKIIITLDNINCWIDEINENIKKIEVLTVYVKKLKNELKSCLK